jgi:hypothetical protein
MIPHTRSLRIASRQKVIALFANFSGQKNCTPTAVRNCSPEYVNNNNNNANNGIKAPRCIIALNEAMWQ